MEENLRLLEYSMQMLLSIEEFAAAAEVCLLSIEAEDREDEASWEN